MAHKFSSKREVHSDSALCLQKKVLVEKEIFLTAKLGHGGQGVVYSAIDSQSNALAVKVIAKCYSRQNPGKVSMTQTVSVRREALLLKSIDHPTSLKFHSFHEDETAWYIVTELLQGADLFDVVCSSSFTENEILLIAKQMCELLVYLHANGIAHRDIKLENVMCVRKGSLRVKLIDYGLAHAAQLEGTDIVNTHPGTFLYKAPELVQKRMEMDPRPADVWALGCMLFTACCGEYAFKGSSDIELAHNIVSQELVMPARNFAKVTDPFKQLLRDLLNKDASQRITAKQALNRIEKILATRVVRANPTSAATESRPSRTSMCTQQDPQPQQCGQVTKALKQIGLFAS